MALDLDGLSLEETVRHDGRNSGRQRSGPGQHASRKPGGRDGDYKPGSDFWDRIQRGSNTTKVAKTTPAREVASQIAAQARAAVDCPVLQCVGPQSTNQGMKAIAIARTYLHQSDRNGASSHPDLAVYPEFIQLEGDEPLSAMQLVIRKRTRRLIVSKEGRSLKVGTQTDAKSLAGAIASCTREGARVELTSIGAGSVNQAIKAVAIARQYVEEEAIDLCCRPEFVEINEGGDGAATSAMRLLILVEQT